MTTLIDITKILDKHSQPLDRLDTQLKAARPALSVTIAKAKTAAEVGDAIASAWLGYGLKEETQASEGDVYKLAITTKAKTFDDAMRYLWFKPVGKPEDGSVVYTMPGSNFQVDATFSGDNIKLLVRTKQAAEVTKGLDEAMQALKHLPGQHDQSLHAGVGGRAGQGEPTKVVGGAKGPVFKDGKVNSVPAGWKDSTSKDGSPRLSRNIVTKRGAKYDLEMYETPGYGGNMRVGVYIVHTSPSGKSRGKDVTFTNPMPIIEWANDVAAGKQNYDDIRNVGILR